MPRTLALAVIAIGSGLLAGLSPSAAPAQSGRMDCFSVQGGRPVCTTSRDSMVDTLDKRARAGRLASAREKKLVKAVAQAVHDGRCEEALALALKSDNPMVAANTARLCGIPETPPAGSPG